MRRAGLSLLLLACALAGALTAVVLAGPVPASTFQTPTTGPADTTPPPPAPTPTPTPPPPAPTPTPTPTPTPPPPPPTIAAGVKIGNVAVGGLMPGAADAAVRAAYRKPLVIRYDGRVLRVTAGQLGTTTDIRAAVNRARTAKAGTNVALPLRVNQTAVRRYVDGLGRRFDRSPSDARLVLRNFRPAIVGERNGRALDRTHATGAILTALRRHARGPVVLQGRTTAPRVRAASYGRVIVIRRGSNGLQLYHRQRLLRSFPVATGESRYPTPLGRFSVVTKARNPWWYPPNSDWAKDAKPIPPGPGNPLGTRWLGLSVSAVGIHGTPDAASIGYSVSHGCIRMRIPDAEWLFDRVPVGTPVFIVPA